MTVDDTNSPDRKRNPSLEPFFAPESVVVIGAVDGGNDVARVVLENLQASDPKFPVFAADTTGLSPLSLPESFDLAVIATPAPTVPGVVRECVRRGARGAIVLSGGFRENGPDGVALERELLNEARQGGLRVIGPNCLGVMAPVARLNATPSRAMATPGSVAFLSQSGALCTAMLDWSQRECVGFSAIFSVGSMVDVGWGDLIHFLGEDSNTRAIVLYMEHIGDARSFMSAAREVALRKPIIVIRAGDSQAKTTRSDDVLNAAFRRSGVLRVNNISDVFYMVEVLAKQPRPRGPRLTIVSNAGGPGLLAAGSLEAGGGQLAELPAPILANLASFLPEGWNPRNPLDLLGDADAERFRRTLEVVVKDPDTDGVLVIFSPQGLANPTSVAESVRDVVKSVRKPVLASWMGGQAVAEGVRLLNRAGVPMFPYPDTAAKAFTYLWQYSYRLQGLYETPSLNTDEHLSDQKHASEQLIQQVRQQNRTRFTESEARKLLALYGIPVGAPTGIGNWFELFLASRSDPEFGPVLWFGTGGKLADVLDDRAYGLAPMTTTLARRMMEQTRIWNALRAEEAQSASTDALEELVVRFSRLVVEQRWIREITINPLMAESTGFRAGDVSVEVYPHGTNEADVPKPAIRPYPIQYVRSWVTRQNVVVNIRPIRPEDEHRMVDFHQRLSERTVYQRYFHHLKLETRIAHERLANICFVDYDRQMVLVAERTNASSGERELVGVARLVKLLNVREAEFAVLIADDFQGHGLGSEMVRMLLQIAKEEHVSLVRAEMLAENAGMISLCRKLGFRLDLRAEECTFEAQLALN